MPLHQLAVAPADVSGSKAPDSRSMRPHRRRWRSARCAIPTAACCGSGCSAPRTSSRSSTPPARFSEQVSCTAGSDVGELPEHTEAPATRWNRAPELTTRRRFVDSRANSATGAEPKPGWLGGTFPGDDAALTALAAEPDGAGWRWQTWHLYPRPRRGPAAKWSTRRAGGVREPQTPVLVAGGLAVAAAGVLDFRNHHCCRRTLRPISRATITSTPATRTERDTCAPDHPTRWPTRSPTYQEPEARADNDNTEYLRYSNNIVIVGPEGDHPCSIRVEGLSAGYNHGAFSLPRPRVRPRIPVERCRRYSRRPRRNQVTPHRMEPQRRSHVPRRRDQEPSTSIRY